MILGVIGLSMLFGTISAVYAVASGGSVLMALGIYSLSGFLATLIIAAFFAFRSDGQEKQNGPFAAITPAE